MKLEFMREDSLYTLKREVKDITDYYEKSNTNWIKKITGLNHNYGLSNISYTPFKLTDNNFENIKTIYSNLKLTDREATDERLWAALTHNMFYDYMHKNYPLPKEKRADFILKNYFLKGNNAYLVNGISRLWWFGRLTYDGTYELTEYISNDLDFYSSLFENSFMWNKRLLRILLYTIKDHNLSKKEISNLIKRIDMQSGKILLDYLSDDEFKELIERELVF